LQSFDLLKTRIRRSTVLDLTLLGVWFAGVSLGLLAARSYGEVFGALARSAGLGPLHFSDACMASLLPLLFAAFAVIFFHRWGVYLACGIRGFLMGFTLGVLCGAGGLWLCALLFFSGLFGSPILLWFLRRRLHMGMTGLREDSVRCVLLCLVLAAVDTWVVAPFLAAALSY